MIPKFKFRTDLNNLTHIEIDGREINGIERAEILYEVNELPRVRLDIIAKEIDLDAECAQIAGQMKMNIGDE